MCGIFNKISDSECSSIRLISNSLFLYILNHCARLASINQLPYCYLSSVQHIILETDDGGINSGFPRINRTFYKGVNSTSIKVYISFIYMSRLILWFGHSESANRLRCTSWNVFMTPVGFFI